MTDVRSEATDALIAHSNGDAEGATRLFPLVYDSLRALAGTYMRRERSDHTLQPTALVHEVFLRLIDGRRIDWREKSHFCAIAAIEMRRVLAEHARAHRALKRGGGARLVTLDENFPMGCDDELEVVALHEVLERLEHEKPRRYRVVELRFFGGLSISEVAHVLEVSEATVKADWRVARAWLARELAHDSADE